jgi:hypothetical protein
MEDDYIEEEEEEEKEEEAAINIIIIIVRYEPQTFLFNRYLGAIEKLRKVTISLVMSVCPYGTNLFHWTDFHEI